MKNYFIIVNEKTGAPIVHPGTLPIFWYKRLAKQHAEMFRGTIVKPVNIKEFQKLLSNAKPGRQNNSGRTGKNSF